MRHFLSINDISRDEAMYLLVEASRLKQELLDAPARQRETLPGRVLALLFEKPSLRTRLSFDVGMAQLGGHPVYLSSQEFGLNERESVADVARVVSRMAQGITARVFRHEDLEEMAQFSTVPIINALSDREHPCQALADLMTLRERKGLEGRKIAYLGDGNNVCHSLMLLCAKLGVRFAAATPLGFEPEREYIETARRDGEVVVTHDPQEAVQDADALYTDVWTSMGQEEEAARRMQIFPPYQINADLMRHAKPDAILLHCLPAHRGEEVSAEVLEGAQSAVFDQAENRLHAQKAVLVWLMGDAFAPMNTGGREGSYTPQTPVIGDE